MAENENLGKSEATFRHGAVFAPPQCLYQKQETRAMESPKMYSSSRCKKRTYLCGSANYPVSCKAVQGREWKFGEIRAFLPPWCSVCTIKRNLGLWRAQKCIPLVGAKSSLTCEGPQTTPSHVSLYMAENGNLGKSVATFRHDAVFAP